jgi:hypothetical protein
MVWSQLMKGLFLCLALLAACRRAPPGISVARSGGDYLFRFDRCGPAEEDWRIMNLDLYPVGESEALCSLVLTHDPRMTIAGQWRYGDVPPAYKKKRCDPLAPGRLYRMEVTHATLEFQVTPDGAVKILSTSCR